MSRHRGAKSASPSIPGRRVFRIPNACGHPSGPVEHDEVILTESRNKSIDDQADE